MFDASVSVERCCSARTELFVPFRSVFNSNPSELHTSSPNVWIWSLNMMRRGLLHCVSLCCRCFCLADEWGQRISPRHLYLHLPPNHHQQSSLGLSFLCPLSQTDVNSFFFFFSFNSSASASCFWNCRDAVDFFPPPPPLRFVGWRTMILNRIECSTVYHDNWRGAKSWSFSPFFFFFSCHLLFTWWKIYFKTRRLDRGTQQRRVLLWLLHAFSTHSPPPVTPPPLTGG